MSDVELEPTEMPAIHERADEGEEILRLEGIVKHLGMSHRQAIARAEALLAEVGMPEPRRRLRAYPHQLSGGQQQRVMIAMALACEPKLLIADEPTTALDVTIQRQILELLAKLKEQHRMGMLFISHDLGVVGEIADHVVVMRHGVVREQGPVAKIFAAPEDAYTQALLACRPTLELRAPRLRVVDDHIAGRAAAAAAKAKDLNARVVLEASGLTKSFWIPRGPFGRAEFRAVKGATFRLRAGHTLGVVGESGSGKTTLGLTLLRLHRDVERAHCLVEDEHLGAQRQAARDRDALPLAARELVRVLVERGLVEADLGEQRARS